MATELALERDDKGEIGIFANVQEVIRQVFPTVQFEWTTSGQEKLRLAKERGIEFPEALRKSLETLPSLLQGQAELDDAFVEFGLGYQEPIRCIYVTPRGEGTQLDELLDELATTVDGNYVVSGNETNRH